MGLFGDPENFCNFWGKEQTSDSVFALKILSRLDNHAVCDAVKYFTKNYAKFKKIEYKKAQTFSISVCALFIIARAKIEFLKILNYFA